VAWSIRHVLVAVALLAALIAEPAIAQSPSGGDSTAIGNTVLISETGHAVRPADHRGKVVFINFWGSWCTPCMVEMNSIRRLQADLGNRRDVVFMFVSARPSSFDADTAWLKQHGVVGENYRWQGAAGLSVPMTFVLGPNGAIAEFKNSAIDWSVHADSIARLLPPRAL